MFKHLFGAKIGIIPYYIYRKLFENIQLCTKSPPDSASLRGFSFYAPTHDVAPSAVSIADAIDAIS